MALLLKWALAARLGATCQNKIGVRPVLPDLFPTNTNIRTYASKKKEKGSATASVRAASLLELSGRGKGSHAQSTSGFVPASQLAFEDADAQTEYQKTSDKMTAAVEWLRKEVAGLRIRGTGHVTPMILDPVRVVLADSPKELRLEEVATIGVREGINLIVTLFEAENLKYVEKAIYGAKLPNVIPQKVDQRTLKIVIPRPTMEARVALLSTASKTAEDTRVQIRKVKDACVRKHKWKPRSDEVEQFQKLCDSHIKQVDLILSQARQDLVT